MSNWWERIRKEEGEKEKERKATCDLPAVVILYSHNGLGSHFLHKLTVGFGNSEISLHL